MIDHETIEAKHTPGPWFANGSNIVYLGEGDENYISADPHGVDVDICQVMAQYEYDNDVKTALQNMSETEANVRLIAAAPELFDALNKLIIFYEHKCLSRADWDNARHAIKRALTGEFE